MSFQTFDPNSHLHIPVSLPSKVETMTQSVAHAIQLQNFLNLQTCQSPWQTQPAIPMQLPKASPGQNTDFLTLAAIPGPTECTLPDVASSCNSTILNAVCNILTSSPAFTSKQALQTNFTWGISPVPTSQTRAKPHQFPFASPNPCSFPQMPRVPSVDAFLENVSAQLPALTTSSLLSKRKIADDDNNHSNNEASKMRRTSFMDTLSSISPSPRHAFDPSHPAALGVENTKRMCKHGTHAGQCKACRASSACEHNRRRSRCKDCGGSGICSHGRQRNYCKECGGSGICEHNRKRSLCKDCGGSSICVHGRQRSRCRDCGGSQICEHNRRRSLCKECGGSQICVHQRQRSLCKDCGGSQICVHKRRKRQCKECAALRNKAAAVTTIKEEQEQEQEQEEAILEAPLLCKAA